MTFCCRKNPSVVANNVFCDDVSSQIIRRKNFFCDDIVSSQMYLRRQAVFATTSVANTLLQNSRDMIIFYDDISKCRRK